MAGTRQAEYNESLRLDPGRTAIVTIDMHRGHLDPEDATMPLPPAVRESVLAHSHRFLTAARSLGVPVIHVVFGTTPERAYRYNPRVELERVVMHDGPPAVPGIPVTRAMVEGVVHNIIGSRQCELMPEVGPEPGDVVVATKTTLSSFYGTELDAILQGLPAVDTLVLLGVTSNGCVLCAAFESANRGYATIVLSDCVGTMSGDFLHEASLEMVAAYLGWVLTCDQALQKLTDKAAGEVAS